MKIVDADPAEAAAILGIKPTDQTTPEPEALMLIDLDLIDPNPWQPRGEFNDEDVEDLADDINRIGLLQEPLLRPVGDRYQSAFGHRRIAAVRLLWWRGGRNWGGKVPAKVEERSDQEMAYIALSENDEREDISTYERLNAWRRALEIEGITKQSLADRVGVDRGTLSKNLRVLDLPGAAGDLIHQGELSARAAYVLTGLQSPTHSHDDMIEAALADCAQDGTYGRQDEPADYRVKTVRRAVRGLTSGRPPRGYRYTIQNPERLWRPLVNVQNPDRSPVFDVEQFVKDLPDDVHMLPSDGQGERLEPWTCNLKEWRRRQTAARKADKKDAEERVEAGNTETFKTWLKVIKADPFVASVVGKRNIGRKVEQADFTEEEIAALGKRIELLKDSGHTTSDPEFIALPFEAHPEMAKSAPVAIAKADKPPMFDFRECQTCPMATWGVLWWDGEAQLYCADTKRYNDKKSQGMQQFYKYRDRVRETDDNLDHTQADRLQMLLVGEADLAETIFCSFWSWMAEAQAVRPLAQAHSYNEYGKTMYHPDVAEMLAAEVGLNLPPGHGQDWRATVAWRTGMKRFVDDPPETTNWPLIASLALVWRARVTYGLGARMGTVAPGTVAGVCRACGCGDMHACETEVGPCWWVADDLCSNCGTTAEADEEESNDESA